MKTANYGDAAGHCGSGIAARVGIRDLVAHPLPGGVLHPKAVLIKPGEIAGEVVGVSGDGARRGSELGCERIEPQSSQPRIGVYGMLLVRRILPWQRLQTSCQNVY